MHNKSSPFVILKNRKIIDILIGDDNLDEEGKIKMPYLSGPNICSISSLFGFSLSYSNKGAIQSRWCYFNDLFDYCLESGKVQELFQYLFSKSQFKDMYLGYEIDIIESMINKTKDCAINKINSVLIFSDHELKLVGAQFIISKRGAKVEVELPTLKMINAEYIQSIFLRCQNDITEKNYDSAITKMRTMLEEIFFHLLEKNGVKPVENGSIKDLYMQVKSLYNMHQSPDMDTRINGLLSGLEKIIASIGEMRNKNSDSHGVGSKRIKINEHHVRLFLNAASMFAEFILAVDKCKIDSYN